MTYQRVVRRNGLHGDYGVRASLPVQYVQVPTRMDPQGEPDMASRASIAGDLRRLEQDTRDANHLAMYAALSGASIAQVDKVFEAFFSRP